MSLQAQYLGCPDERIEAAAAAISPGEVVIPAAGSPGIYLGNKPALSGEKITLALKGNYRCNALSTDTFSIGDTVYWDDTNNRCTSTAAGNTDIGEAVAAKTSGPTTVDLRLNHAI